MKLRPRLTLFTLLLIIIVVSVTSLLTIFSLRYLLQSEMKRNQVTLFTNFRETIQDAIYLGDDLGIKVYSESLENSVPGLAYAVFVDLTRDGVALGGSQSMDRFRRNPPICSPGSVPGESYGMSTVEFDLGRLRVYCENISVTTARNRKIAGTVYLGLNLEFIEAELQSSLTRMAGVLIWTMLFVITLGLFMAYLLSGRITKPIKRLTQGAKDIGDGKLETQIPIESTDELGFLAYEFNLMASKLRELDQLKDDFVSSVSHELRSPLAAISGYVELLTDKPIEKISPERVSKALLAIRQSTERLTHFINDILDLAKIKSGQMELRKKDMNIKDLCLELFHLFQPLFDKNGVKWEVDIPPQLTPLKADEDKIRQVLTNLVSNALKFTPSGGKIRILAKNQNDFMRISVQDDGPGIPEEAQEAIFERFKQVGRQEGQPQAPKGTGLGLAIAKGIVESHGGKIWIESKLGQGTTVHFTLPL